MMMRLPVLRKATVLKLPFLRPAEFARDDTTDLPVFTHALHWLKEKGRLPAGYRGAA